MRLDISDELHDLPSGFRLFVNLPFERQLSVTFCRSTSPFVRPRIEVCLSQNNNFVLRFKRTLYTLTQVRDEARRWRFVGPGIITDETEANETDTDAEPSPSVSNRPT